MSTSDKGKTIECIELNQKLTAKLSLPSETTLCHQPFGMYKASPYSISAFQTFCVLVKFKEF